jgi:hypothetical protein
MRVWIRIGSSSGSRVSMTKNSKKITAGKLFYFFYQKLQFSYPKASIMDFKATAIKRKHPGTLKHENSLLFSIFVGHFYLLDPDPDPATQINADPCRSGSDPNPQHCNFQLRLTILHTVLLIKKWQKVTIFDIKNSG